MEIVLWLHNVAINYMKWLIEECGWMNVQEAAAMRWWTVVPALMWTRGTSMAKRRWVSWTKWNRVDLLVSSPPSPVVFSSMDSQGWRGQTRRLRHEIWVSEVYRCTSHPIHFLSSIHSNDAFIVSSYSFRSRCDIGINVGFCCLSRL